MRRAERAVPQLLRTWAALLLACVLAACSATGGSRPPLEPVAALDTQRYLGSWYEIARYPNSFQRGCVGVTATYTPREDGRIGVRNECRMERLDGPVRSIEGKAWQVGDQADSAKLKVQFFWPFAANYWVIALDPDYRWAVVGEPSRDYLWVLSRTPQMDDTLYGALLERLRGLGYDPARVQRTLQPDA
jgi:apolipoprotein D and lipocalin family protein